MSGHAHGRTFRPCTAPRHPSTSVSCDLGLCWCRASRRRRGRDREQPVPKDQAAARPGAAALGPGPRGGWGRRAQTAPGCLGAYEVQGCVPLQGYSLLQGLAFLTFRGAVAGSLAPVWSRCLARTAAPCTGLLFPREAAQRACTRGLPGALRGSLCPAREPGLADRLHTPRRRAGRAHTTQKSWQALRGLVRAPP